MTFDQLIDRHGTHCAKWDAMEAACGVSGDDALAMWVADMDFRSPDAVQDVMQQFAAHGVFGYPGAMRPIARRSAGGWTGGMAGPSIPITS